MFSLFLSSLIGVYKAALCGMRNHRGTAAGSAADWTNAFVAGAAAGAVSMALDRNKSRRLAVALYALTRATQYGLWWLLSHWRASRAAKRAESESESETDVTNTSNTEKAKVEPDAVDRTLGFFERHGGALTFIASCVAIIYTAVLDQDLLPGGYFRFLVNYSGVDQDYGKDGGLFLTTIRDLVAGKDGVAGITDPSRILIPEGVSTREAFAAHPILQPLAKHIKPDIHHNYLVCAIEHPHDTHCFRAHTLRWLRTMPAMMKLYGTLNLVFMLFGLRRALRNPARTAVRLGLSTMRSTLFYATIYLFTFSVPCAMRRALGYDTIWAYFLNGIAGGSSIFIEPASRRVELAMYTALRAVETVWDLGKRWRWWNPIAHAEVAYFSAAMGVLMALYQNEPAAIREGYRNLMVRSFGKN
ncbi:hypothetical protein GQ42DRAFT_165198 [Ramicandelaber brevisporus]|nr:hypothetical protein GQ42DRAFT_165198 [Ramicandelaber brevisporus]